MRRTQQKKHRKVRKNKETTVKKKVSAVSLGKNRWITRKKAISPYPYLITISYYKSNVFFTVADINGHTKGWTSTGRAGFKNKDKTTYMALVRVTELFYKKVWSLGVRRAILKLRNLSKRGPRAAIRNSLRKIRRLYPVKYLGLLAETQISFNGCRRKKKRRK
jgi:ribosomal protein S11